MTDENRDQKRMEDLERRITALEERTRRELWDESEGPRQRERELMFRYGEFVDKTVAARILGVTRTTIYAMLADGRIQAACSGKRVDVRSIARYMARPHGGEGARRLRGRRKQMPDGMTPPAV